MTKRFLKWIAASVGIGLASIGVGYSMNKPALEVYKAINVSSFDVTKDSDYFVIWREVCVNKDIEVKVFKSFVSTLGDGTEVSYRAQYPSHYGFTTGKCEAGRYPIEVPKHIPNGSYEYRPVVSYIEAGKQKLVQLPSERVNINR